MKLNTNILALVVGKANKPKSKVMNQPTNGLWQLHFLDSYELFLNSRIRMYINIDFPHFGWTFLHCYEGTHKPILEFMYVCMCVCVCVFFQKQL